MSSPPIEDTDRARLLDQIRDAAEQQRATADVLRIMSRSIYDAKSVFDCIVESALRLCDGHNATLALFEGGRARVAANAGSFRDEAGYIAAFGDMPLEPSRSTITGRVLLARATVSIDDLVVLGDELQRAPGPATGARSVIAVPLLRDGEVIGMLVVRRRQPIPFTGREARLLETFADQAVIAIENTRLFQTVRRQSQELSRFVAPQVAALITSDEGAKLLEGHRRQITAVACDLRGFTHFSQTSDPEEVLGLLRSYHASMGELIQTHGGTLEHFAGEGLMVLLNDPAPVDRHELAGVRLAIAMRGRFAEVSSAWRRKGYDLGLSVGVATGYATLGRIGFEGRYDYGAIGSVVLVAARLAAQSEVGAIVISDRVRAAIEDAGVLTTPLGPLALTGLAKPVVAFSVGGA